MIHKLNKLEFKKIEEYYTFFANNKVKCKDVFEVINEYPSVFELDNDLKTDNLLRKIKKVSSDIGKVKILKLDDLLV